MRNEESFLNLLEQENRPDLSPENKHCIAKFYAWVQKENTVQNLTRLTSETEFFTGHLLDVLALIKTNALQYPALDLGSGVGVPGILAALIKKEKWILVESEHRKAEYLARTIPFLGLETQVTLFEGRVETFFREGGSCASIVSRAVGSVERIYSWIRNCSTWNNLILFKGPAWNTEWNTFQKGKFKNHLRIQEEIHYTIPLLAQKKLHISKNSPPPTTNDCTSASLQKSTFLQRKIIILRR